MPIPKYLTFHINFNSFVTGGYGQFPEIKCVWLWFGWVWNIFQPNSTQVGKSLIQPN